MTASSSSSQQDNPDWGPSKAVDGVIADAFFGFWFPDEDDQHAWIQVEARSQFIVTVAGAHTEHQSNVKLFMKRFNGLLESIE